MGWSGVDDETARAHSHRSSCALHLPYERRGLPGRVSIQPMSLHGIPACTHFRLLWWKRYVILMFIDVAPFARCWTHRLTLTLFCLAVVDTRGKGPLLNLESPASVWPPPRSGRVGTPSSELEAPLITPSKFPADLDYAADDCLLDDINTQVGRFSTFAAETGAYVERC